jgi:glutaminase
VRTAIEDLYRRHRPLDRDAMPRFYASGRGYHSLAEAGPEQDQFGVCLMTVDGDVTSAGDWELPFALQSISKVFSYGLALAENGRQAVLQQVGVEPSGDAFNSIVFDEHHARPFNPMVNAGALATTALIAETGQADGLERALDLLRNCAGNPALAVDASTFAAEVAGADRNRATAYLMRSDGMLTGDVEAILGLYLQQCAVLVTCGDLAAMGATLANGGVHPRTGRVALPAPVVRDVLSVMHTCGMYDFAGEWAFSVGLPAKSGVSGGLLLVVPGRMGLAVFSPGLDRFGNSVRATRLCQDLSESRGLHVFAGPERAGAGTG